MDTNTFAEKELEALTLAWEAREAALQGNRQKAQELRDRMNAIYDDLEEGVRNDK